MARHLLGRPNVLQSRRAKELPHLGFLGSRNYPPHLPKIVNVALASLRKFHKGRVIYLSNENLSDYVRLPEHVERLYKRGLMLEALHSDLIRLCLLVQYGGVWCDATCYHVAPFPKQVADAPFFMFSNPIIGKVRWPLENSNWFIKSDAGNVLLRKTYNFLCEYYVHYQRPLTYLIFHVVVALLIHKDAECRKIWDEVPYVCNSMPHLLAFSFANRFTPERLKQKKEACFVHKLTYRYPKALEEAAEENILQHLLREG